MEAYSAYLEHFLIEETQHLRFFSEFCRRYGGRTYPTRSLEFPDRASAEERRFLIFAGILIFEETGHFYNVSMMNDPDLPPIVRAVNRTHYDYEGRHIAAGRQMVADLYDGFARSAKQADLARLRAKVGELRLMNFTTYYNPQVYADTDLEEPFALAATLSAHPGRLAWQAKISTKSTKFFDRLFGQLEDSQGS